MIEKMKSEKGVSLITLGVMIIMLIIISQIAVYNSRNAITLRKLEDMKDDIEILDTKIGQYFVEEGKLPLGEKYTNTEMITSNAEVLNPNDDLNSYYVIDLRKIKNLSLNYGRDYESIDQNKNLTDIYIINEKSHTIYYPKGIELDGKTYYRDNRNYSLVQEK